MTTDLSNQECDAGFDYLQSGPDVWVAFRDSECFEEYPDDNPEVFNTGITATLKVNAENLRGRHLRTVMGHILTHPCVVDAEALLYVPDGMEKIAIKVAAELGKPLARVRKIVHNDRPNEFYFPRNIDEAIAHSFMRVVILEDVVTTLSSTAGVRSLLLPDQEVHTLSMLDRGIIDPANLAGIIHHTLLRRYIPTNKYKFWAKYKQDL